MGHMGKPPEGSARVPIGRFRSIPIRPRDGGLSYRAIGAAPSGIRELGPSEARTAGRGASYAHPALPLEAAALDSGDGAPWAGPIRNSADRPPEGGRGRRRARGSRLSLLGARERPFRRARPRGGSAARAGEAALPPPPSSIAPPFPWRRGARAAALAFAFGPLRAGGSVTHRSALHVPLSSPRPFGKTRRAAPGSVLLSSGSPPSSVPGCSPRGDKARPCLPCAPSRLAQAGSAFLRRGAWRRASQASKACSGSRSRSRAEFSRFRQGGRARP